MGGLGFQRQAQRIARELHRIQADTFGKDRGVRAPFVFGPAQRGGAVDADLALPQRQMSRSNGAISPNVSALLCDEARMLFG